MSNSLGADVAVLEELVAAVVEALGENEVRERLDQVLNRG